jgi:hypothetical protein
MELLLDTQLPPELSWADKIAYLAWKINQNGGVKPEDIEVRHIFEPGRYVREFELPGNFVFIGRTHRKGHLIELLRGSAKLITTKGTTVHRAIDRMSTLPGFQTVAYTLEPCLVRSVHLNQLECRDVAELEDEYFEPVQPLLVRGQGVQEQLKWLD